MLALGAAAALSFGATVAADAQEFTAPNADIRALEAPVDVTPNQLRAQGTLPYYQGRSASDGVVQQLLEAPQNILR